ncbi:MAG: hypothetical protein HYV52_02030 [Parcubacteria group bacterium]|nr:hypothetical protein [Parcubacteria group bacterium]
MKKFFLTIFISLLMPFLTLAIVAKSKPQLNQPLQIILSWTVPSSIPSLYKGRALPTLNSFVQVNADAINGTDKKENLIFKWFVDNDYQPLVSGRNKNNFKFQIKKGVDDLYNIKLELRKTDSSQTLLATKNIFIPITNPEIIFYKLNNETAINKEINMSIGQSIDITAEPYFFNSPKGNLKYEWTINGGKAKTEKPDILNLTAPEGKLLSPVLKSIGLKISKTFFPAQQTEESFNLKISQ